MALDYVVSDHGPSTSRNRIELLGSDDECEGRTGHDIPYSVHHCI